jgi:hypothetical protein
MERLLAAVIPDPKTCVAAENRFRKPIKIGWVEL